MEGHGEGEGEGGGCTGREHERCLVHDAMGVREMVPCTDRLRAIMAMEYHRIYDRKTDKLREWTQSCVNPTERVFSATSQGVLSEDRGRR